MIEDIIDLIQSKKITQHPSFDEGRFFSTPKPDHFTLFKMPEKLLLTAQISKYLIQAEADVSVIPVIFEKACIVQKMGSCYET